MRAAVHGWLDDVLAGDRPRSAVGAIVPPSLSADYGLMPGYFAAREDGDAIPTSAAPPRECVGGTCRLDAAPAPTTATAWSPSAPMVPRPALPAATVPTATTTPTTRATPMSGFDFNAFVNAATKLGDTAREPSLIRTVRGVGFGQGMVPFAAAFAALPAHDELGPSTITFGQIEGGYRPYVVPDRAKVWVDMRLTPPTDTAAAINMVEHAIAVAEAAVPGCHGSYTVTGDRPAIERDPNSPLLAALKRAADDVTDADTTVGFFTGYTDTAVIAGKTGNRNCMSYGPGSLALAHKPNEYAPHADIVRCQQVLIALADNVLWDASGQVGA